MDLSEYRKAAQRRRPLYRPLSADDFAPLAMRPRELDSLLARGVPFHMAVEKHQDERPGLRDVAKRLAAGETLFLVQPHEYLPRIRRFIHRAGLALGFAGRPAASFLFRVDAPGRLIMGLHDDGDSDLLWLQLEGERYLKFGTLGATGRAKRLAAADGKSAGWFEGGLETGSLLYVPPHAPHNVQCRKPSLALSVYWETVSPLTLAGEFTQSVEAPRHLRRLPTQREIEAALAYTRREAAKAYAAWAALRRTTDGGRDRPPDLRNLDWTAPRQQFSAWRAFAVVPQSRTTVALAAGGDRLLEFPVRSRRALELLAHYGVTTREALDAARGRMTAQELTSLLQILAAEHLITAGDLPPVGEFDAADLTGWEYEDRPD